MTYNWAGDSIIHDHGGEHGQSVTASARRRVIPTLLLIFACCSESTNKVADTGIIDSPASSRRDADLGSGDGRIDGNRLDGHWLDGNRLDGNRLDGNRLDGPKAEGSWDGQMEARVDLQADIFAPTVPLGCSTGAAPTCQKLALTSPQTYEVFQRDASNQASVQVAGTFTGTGTVVRIVAELTSGATAADQRFTVDRSAGQTTFAVVVTLAAAPWYRLWVQELPADGMSVIAEGSVAQVGVGEVFLTAGQSNSVAAGEKPQVGSVMTSAAVLNFQQGHVTWTAEIDPSTGTTGTPWPGFAARLAAALGMPVAVMQVGCGGTTVSQWLPNVMPPDYCGSDATFPGALYTRLVTAVGALGSLRAILWHQGESDTALGTSQLDYQARLSLIINQLPADSGKSFPWIVANASYVPGNEIDSATCTFQNQPMQYGTAMLQVRAAQQALWSANVAKRGPDTDWMIGATSRYPGESGACVHFSDLGLKIHGALWYASVSESGLIPGAEAPPSTPNQPLYRYASSLDHYLTPAYVNPPPPGYIYEGIGMKVYSVQDANMVPLYPCLLVGGTYTGGQHFLSTNASCETFTSDGAIVGYLLGWPSPGTVPIIRIYSATTLDFLSTPNLDEALVAGYVVQGLQGFAPR